MSNKSGEKKKRYMVVDQEKLDKTAKRLNQKYDICLGADNDLEEMEKELFIIRNTNWGNIETDTPLQTLMGSIGFCDYISEIGSYKADIDIAIFMYIGIQYSGADDDIGGIKDTLDLIKVEQDEERGARNRYSPEILKYFPVEFCNIKSTRWCRIYQNIMLHKDNNAEIFNIKKKSNDISRYGYIKSQRLYDAMKDKNIENMLLLEMTCGIVLSEILYPFVSQFSKGSDMEKIESVLKELCKIPCMTVRKKVALYFFEYMYENSFSDESIKNTVNILEEYGVKITTFYEDLFDWELWYFLIRSKDELLDGKKVEKYLEKERCELEMCWETYSKDVDTLGFYIYDSHCCFKKALPQSGELKRKYYESRGVLKLKELMEIENVSSFSNRFIECEGDRTVNELRERYFQHVQTCELVNMTGKEKKESEKKEKDSYNPVIYSFSKETVDSIKIEMRNLFDNSMSGSEEIKISKKLSGSQLTFDKIYALLHRYITFYLLENWKDDKIKGPENSCT